jgi:1-phosphofructokinase
MIVTLTPNPSLDRSLALEQLLLGEVNRADSVRVDPGGKGVNVARALLANGHPVRAVLPIGGRDGEHVADLLAALGLDSVGVPIEGDVRENVSLVEPDGRVTKVNAAGPRLTRAEVARLVEATITALDGATWVAASGSLPPGAPEDLYAVLASDVHAAGARLAVDTSGSPLRAAVAGGPDLLKPNVDELAEVSGCRLRTLGDVVDAGRRLQAEGVAALLVSLGADGAVLLDDAGAWHATTPPLVPRSDVGAGDATLAGFLAAGGEGPDALVTAVAYGAAAVRLPGSQMPSPTDIDRGAVTVTEINPGRILHG